MTEETLTIIRKEKPNSYEFGPASNRFTLVFNTVSDLIAQHKELKEAGFITDDD